MEKEYAVQFYHHGTLHLDTEAITLDDGKKLYEDNRDKALQYCAEGDDCQLALWDVVLDKDEVLSSYAHTLREIDYRDAPNYETESQS